MKPPIVCFGASVTRQTNGYVDYLSNFLENEIYKEGYGSMHLKDAGICFLDKIISYKPGYCLIDWFSTSKTDYGNQIIKYLDAITYKLLGNNIEPIFLLFPISIMLETRVEMYNHIREYAKKYKIHIIDICNISAEENINTTNLLKDYVHTSQYGSVYYAKKIALYIKNYVLNIDNKTILPKENKYSNIKEFVFPIQVNDFIEIEIDDELIGIYQKIGPYSDSVSIYDNEIRLLNTQNIWDVWCHYERETIKIEIFSPGKYLIKLNNNSVNKNNCKKTFNFTDFTKNILNLQKFYFTDNLSIINYE